MDKAVASGAADAGSIPAWDAIFCRSEERRAALRPGKLRSLVNGLKILIETAAL